MRKITVEGDEWTVSIVNEPVLKFEGPQGKKVWRPAIEGDKDTLSDLELSDAALEVELLRAMTDFN